MQTTMHDEPHMHEHSRHAEAVNELGRQLAAATATVQEAAKYPDSVQDKVSAQRAELNARKLLARAYADYLAVEPTGTFATSRIPNRHGALLESSRARVRVVHNNGAMATCVVVAPGNIGRRFSGHIELLDLQPVCQMEALHRTLLVLTKLDEQLAKLDQPKAQPKYDPFEVPNLEP
jgi:hypothetical protein